MLDMSKHVKSVNGKSLPIVIQKHKEFANGASSRLLLTVKNADPMNMPSATEIAAAFEEQFVGSKLLVNSIHTASTSNAYFNGMKTGIVSAVAVAKQASCSLEHALQNGWKKMSESIFTDPSDQLWEVAKGTAEGVKMLIRKSADDLTALFSDRQSRAIHTATGEMDFDTEIANHIPVIFTDIASGENVFGIAVNTDTENASFDAYVPATNTVTKSVSTLQVLAYGDSSVADTSVSKVDTAAVSVDAALEYYRKLYSGEYLAKIEEALRRVAQGAML